MNTVTKNEFLNYSKEIRVLYVEDNSIQCRITQHLVNGLFKSFDVANDGKEGFEKYLPGDYDLVITDINMPEMDGLELVKKIKDRDPDQYIAVTSSTEDSEVLIDFINEGIDLFILKPLDLDKIQHYLYKACKRISKDRELERLKEKRVYDSVVVTANHEINQHLGTIIGNIQLCYSLSDKCINDENKKYLDKIKNSAQGISKILTKMSQVSSIEFVEYATSSEMVDIHKEDKMEKDGV